MEKKRNIKIVNPLVDCKSETAINFEKPGSEWNGHYLEIRFWKKWQAQSFTIISTIVT